MLSLVLLLITLAAVAASFVKDRERTKKALRIGWLSFFNLLPAQLTTVALIGLVLALMPPGMLSELFRNHGVVGFVLISAVGALLIMPAPVAFPLAGSLLHQGVSLPALAAFITTLTMVGTVTAPMEIACFGKRFTLIRQTLSLALAISIGALMGMIL